MANAISTSTSQAPPQETTVGYEPHWYSRAPLHIVVILISVLWLMPSITLLFTSVRNIQDINTSIWWQLLWKPHQFTLENYNSVLQSAGSIGMGRAFINTLVPTIPAT